MKIHCNIPLFSSRIYSESSLLMDNVPLKKLNDLREKGDGVPILSVLPPNETVELYEKFYPLRGFFLFFLGLSNDLNQLFFFIFGQELIRTKISLIKTLPLVKQEEKVPSLPFLFLKNNITKPKTILIVTGNNKGSLLGRQRNLSGSLKENEEGRGGEGGEGPSGIVKRRFVVIGKENETVFFFFFF